MNKMGELTIFNLLKLIASCGSNVDSLALGDLNVNLNITDDKLALVQAMAEPVLTKISNVI